MLGTIHNQSQREYLILWGCDVDRRIGCCIDTGHTFRVPIDPAEAIYVCRDRLYEVHLKDVAQATRERVDAPLGRGVIDIASVLRALVEVKFDGHVALENHIGPEDTRTVIAESFGYIRGVLAKPLL